MVHSKTGIIPAKALMLLTTASVIPKESDVVTLSHGHAIMILSIRKSLISGWSFKRSAIRQPIVINGYHV